MMPVPVTVRFDAVDVFQLAPLPAIVQAPEPTAIVRILEFADVILLDAPLSVTLKPFASNVPAFKVNAVADDLFVSNAS